MLRLIKLPRISLNGFRPLKRFERFMGIVTVEPKTSLVTQTVSIQGQNFKPHHPITIQAILKSTSQGLSFNSYAHYFTSEDGSFDLFETKSLAGSYVGKDGMGLFWSMTKSDDSKHLSVQTVNGKEPLNYEFNVYDSHILDFSSASPIQSLRIERWFTSESVSRVVVKEEGIRGTMFIPEGSRPFPAVITLYGGNKSKQVVEDAAAILSNYGIVTFALAYFGVEGVRKSYVGETLQIEEFERAVNFLQSKKYIDEKFIGVLGQSKGGEIGLAMATHLPQIKAVAGINASVASIGTETTYKDHVTKCLGIDPSRAQIFPDQTVQILRTLNDPLDEPDSIYPIEQANADLLLIAGIDDLNWDSVYFTKIAKDRMDEAQKTNYEIIHYEGLGHMIDAPYMPPCIKFAHPHVPRNFLVLFGGEDIKKHSKHQVDVWNKVVNFFLSKLKLTSSKL